MDTERAVLIRYERDGSPRRGSGLRVGGSFVLTADHCANGTGHRVVVGGREYAATVHVRSARSDVDIAVLDVPDLAAMTPLRCAVVDRAARAEIGGCSALGYPVWKGSASQPLLAQVSGYIPTAEDYDPYAVAGPAARLTLKITDPEARGHFTPAGPLDAERSQWSGLSGAAVVTADELIVGIVRSHNFAEGGQSLTVTPIAAIDNLPQLLAHQLWAALGVTDPEALVRLPRPAAPAVSVDQLVVGAIPRQPLAFVARETVDRLAAAAERGQVAVVSAVTGMRGVGKTQVAAAYARQRVADGWPLVGWVNAETRDGLLGGLAQVAERVGVSDPEGDSLESARRLRDHLETRSGAALLVFDNATDPDGVRPFLPATGSAQIVVTSTDLAFAELGESVNVAQFSRQESLAFLRERTGRVDDDGAEAVADALGDLPLGLAQAASTIRRQNLSFAAYQERLLRVPVRKLLGRRTGDDYPYATAAALLLSIEAAEAYDGTALVAPLLRTFAVLSPDGVRRPLLDGLSEVAVTEPGAVDAAIERCVTGSLLTWSVSGDALIMHRLVARVLRERDQTDGAFAHTVIHGLELAEAGAFDERFAWQRRDDGAHLVAQIEALWEASSAGLEDAVLAAHLLSARSWAVQQLSVAADVARAIELGARVLSDSERVLGVDHPDTLASRNNLAGAYESAGRLDEAIRMYEGTLTDVERVLGLDDPDTLISRNNLAYAYESAGRLDEAIGLHERTLADRHRVLGGDHPDTLASRNNLAYAYGSAGRLDEAIMMYEESLVDFERVLGGEHPYTLASRNNLASAYESAGRLDDAVGLHERTLIDRERLMGGDHPDTLASRNNLAGAYQSAGRLDEAITMYEQSLTDFERVLGGEHPHTLASRNNLAHAYESAGRLDEAIWLHERTLLERERVLGGHHPGTLTSRNNLAYVYRSAGRLSEAIELYERTLTDCERILGPEHPTTKVVRANFEAMQSAG